MTRAFSSYDELVAAVGDHLGYSEWLTIDQTRIDTFAEATGDSQWIHVDPRRAAAGPFGATIAHGYLTLALLPALVTSLVEYPGWSVKINYGSNKVRFPQPVRVGSRIRAGVELSGVVPGPTGTQVTLKVSVEVEDSDGRAEPKPALVAEILTLLV